MEDELDPVHMQFPDKANIPMDGIPSWVKFPLSMNFPFHHDHHMVTEKSVTGVKGTTGKTITLHWVPCLACPRSVQNSL